MNATQQSLVTSPTTSQAVKVTRRAVKDTAMKDGKQQGAAGGSGEDMLSLWGVDIVLFST